MLSQTFPTGRPAFGHTAFAQLDTKNMSIASSHQIFSEGPTGRTVLTRVVQFLDDKSVRASRHVNWAFWSLTMHGNKPALATAARQLRDAIKTLTIRVGLTEQNLLSEGEPTEIDIDKLRPLRAVYACHGGDVTDLDLTRLLVKSDNKGPNMLDRAHIHLQFQAGYGLDWAEQIGNKRKSTLPGINEVLTGSGETALHLAIRYQQPDAVRRLLELKADPDIRTLWHHSAKDYAAMVGGTTGASVTQLLNQPPEPVPAGCCIIA